MSPHIIVLAAALKVAVPGFTLDQAPGVFAGTLSSEVARVIEAEKCGSAIAAAQFTEELSSSFKLCAGQQSCLIVAGRSLGIDVVLAGHVKKEGDNYTISLTPLDARAGRARPGQQFTATGRPTEIVKYVGQNAQLVCQTVDPEWKPVIKVVRTEPAPPASDDLLLLPDFDLPEAADPPPSVASPKLEVTPTPPNPVAKAEPAPVLAPPPKVEPPPVVVEPPLVKAEPPPVLLPPPVVKPEVVAEKPPAPVVDAGREVKVTPGAMPFPWVLVTSGGALLTGVVGLGLGIGSRSIWSDDHPVEQAGAVRHSITHAQALQANRLAIGANVLFGVAGALGITTGVLIYANGGLGLSGRF